MIRRPPADVFFETEGLRATLDAVRAALASSDAAILLEGPPGAGKTAFLRRLVRSEYLGDACWIDAEHPLGEARVLAAIGRSFGLGGAPLPELADGIAGYGASALPFLVVDDAHNLSPFALRLVLELRQLVRARGSRFALVMAAPPRSLERAFASPSLARFRDELERITLPPFSEDDTREFLVRITDASAGGEDALETRARALHRASGGLPGEIRRMADALRRGVAPAPRRNAAAVPAVWRGAHRVWAVPAAVTGVTAGAVLYLAWALFQGAPVAEDAGLAVPPGAEVMQAGPATPLAAVDEDFFVTEAVPPSTDTPVAAVEAAPPPAAPAPAQPAAAQPAAVRPAPAAGPVAPPRTLTDREWLMAQDPQRYTIQLASTPDRAGAEAFIEKHPLRGRTIALETQRGARTIYIVLHESFASSAEARRAIEGLPPTLRRNDPFARRIASVQEMAGG